MYGKLWESMYTGSMFGAGLGPFALMPYVISNMKPCSNGSDIEMRLELNPKLLAVILGTDERVIEGAIEWACKPDPKSRTKTEGGRRLVKIGEFEYRVVNGWAYTNKIAIERRREQFRKASKKYRSKTPKNIPDHSAASRAFVRSVENGEPVEKQDAIVEGTLPRPRLDDTTDHETPF